MGKILMKLCESISSIGTQLPVNTRVSQHRCRNTGVAACGKETDLLGMQTGISLFSKKSIDKYRFFCYTYMLNGLFFCSRLSAAEYLQRSEVHREV